MISSHRVCMSPAQAMRSCPCLPKADQTQQGVVATAGAFQRQSGMQQVPAGFSADNTIQGTAGAFLVQQPPAMRKYAGVCACCRVGPSKGGCKVAGNSTHPQPVCVPATAAKRVGGAVPTVTPTLPCPQIRVFVRCRVGVFLLVAYYCCCFPCLPESHLEVVSVHFDVSSGAGTRMQMQQCGWVSSHACQASQSRVGRGSDVRHGWPGVHL